MKSKYVRFLGEGAYGSVYLMKYTNLDGSWSHAAVKTSYADAYEYLEKEVQILSELHGYPNIVRCLGHELEESVDKKGNKVYKLSLEYAPEGCLSDLMSKYPDRKLPVAMIRVFTTMILEGLALIHSHGYVHCDLKPDNLLVFPLNDDSYSLKISDFGNALEAGKVPDLWAIDFPYVGTPIYMPPESIRDGVANKTLDLWSLGCLVLEMFTGERPWKGVRLHDLTNVLLGGKAPLIPESLPCDAREFIGTCFSRNPEDRGTALDLLSHHFLCREEEDVASVVEETRETEEKIVSDFVVVEETREIEDQIVSDRRDSSWLLKLKLKLRITKDLKKWKALNVAEKRPLIFPSKPPQFKNLFNRLLRLKSMPTKSLDLNLVSVQ